jgi:predicted amidohydrolase
VAAPAPLRAAVLQLNSTPDVAANVETALGLVDEAAARGARLLVLPEKFHYLGPPEDVAAAKEPLDGPLLTACAEAAKRHGVYLVAGSIWESIRGDERTYNTSVLFGPDGERLALYRKIHMFDVEVGGQVYRESDSCRPGDRVVAVRLDPGASGRPGHGQVTLGLSICYDLRFPELFRALLDLGSHVITMPSAFTMATGRDHWQVLVRARAIENQLFMVAANQTGIHAAGLESYGRSLIVDPWGVVLGQVADGVGVAVADLDLHRLAQVRRLLPAVRHRVPEAYLHREVYEHGEVVSSTE